jgi:hypothetical protein
VPTTPTAIVLSHFQTRGLSDAFAAGRQTAELSPDLGLSMVQAALMPAGVMLPGQILLAWATVQEINAATNNCFSIQPDGEARKIVSFSESSNRSVSLYPTSSAPTMLLGGIPMHRIKDTDPLADTREKIKAARPIAGQVLDTHTGLGYTAIEAARTADHVLTIEIDPTVLEIASENLWSRDLFTNLRITQRLGDCFDVVQELPGAAFDRVIHDPPAFSLAGHVYSRAFYQELYRVLRHRGRLFHYIGNPASPSGKSVTQGVVRRLKDAGFTRVEPAPRAFGVVASKS